jgi:hypothetical protein
MSEKKRQKKDGERKDKNNQAMRDAVGTRTPKGQAPQGGRPNNSTTDEPGAGATDNARGQGSKR